MDKVIANDGNVVTIRELNGKLCQILESVVTSGQGIVVTKNRKPYVEIKCCNNSHIEGENVVTFKAEDVDVVTNVVTIPKISDEIRERLRAKTAEIIGKPPVSEAGPVKYCEACKRLRLPLKEAIGEFEVDEGDGIKKRWLCERHSKIALVGIS